MIKERGRFAIAFSVLYVLASFIYYGSNGFNLMYLFLSGLVILGCSMYYFTYANATAKEGLMLGVAFLLAGTILDLLLIFLGYVEDPTQIGDIILLYKSSYFWYTILELLAITTLVGHLMSNPDS